MSKLHQYYLLVCCSKCKRSQFYQDRISRETQVIKNNYQFMFTIFLHKKSFEFAYLIRNRRIDIRKKISIQSIGEVIIYIRL